MITNYLYKAKDLRDGNYHWWLVGEQGVAIFPWNGETKAGMTTKLKEATNVFLYDITTFQAFAVKPQLIAEW
ncbi:hypothetical protein [Escherichia phage phiWec179]|nr:hypothetical protein [Escherichia phage phiWec179]BDU12333.1 hypothetical protein [Escherichia phage phiWec181]BDU12773.1 hypothetical protein [Escherichia phage phiWec186]